MLSKTRESHVSKILWLVPQKKQTHFAQFWLIDSFGAKHYEKLFVSLAVGWWTTAPRAGGRQRAALMLRIDPSAGPEAGTNVKDVPPFNSNRFVNLFFWHPEMPQFRPIRCGNSVFWNPALALSNSIRFENSIFPEIQCVHFPCK